jgi:hypothetical protein
VHDALASTVMDIWFADPETAAVCCCLRELRARWGPDGGPKVGRRLLQMKAAPTLAALRSLPGRCRRCDSGDGNWLIDVDGVATIMFRPEPTTSEADGSRIIVRATVISVIDHPMRGGRS